MDMFERQRKVIGNDGQEKLSKASIAIVGAGGLGSLVGELCARIGIGKILLFDNDVVEEHNLSRQHLYDSSDIGKYKAEISREKIKSIRRECLCESYVLWLDEKNISLCKDVDVIIDCGDNRDIRNVINDFSLRLNIPWVHGAVLSEFGEVCFFSGKKNDPCYECLNIGKSLKKEDNSIYGIIATTVTLIGTLQVQLLIDYLLGRQISQKLLRVNLRNYSMNQIGFMRREECNKH